MSSIDRSSDIAAEPMGLRGRGPAALAADLNPPVRVRSEGFEVEDHVAALCRVAVPALAADASHDFLVHVRLEVV
jgi:hypothetical protein